MRLFWIYIYQKQVKQTYLHIPQARDIDSSLPPTSAQSVQPHVTTRSSGPKTPSTHLRHRSLFHVPHRIILSPHLGRLILYPRSSAHVKVSQLKCLAFIGSRRTTYVFRPQSPQRLKRWQLQGCQTGKWDLMPAKKVQLDRWNVDFSSQIPDSSFQPPKTRKGTVN